MAFAEAKRRLSWKQPKLPKPVVGIQSEKRPNDNDEIEAPTRSWLWESTLGCFAPGWPASRAAKDVRDSYGE
jgi:hypothetical protein